MKLLPTILWTLMSVNASVTATDSNGTVRHPLAGKTNHGTVLIFVGVDCPVSNSYAPELKRICNEFTKKGIAFDLVYADPSVTAKDVNKHLTDYGYHCTALLDPKQDLVHLAGVKVTPEVAVFDSVGIEVYHGRIDDLYPEVGKKRYTATTHELRTVLDDLANNRVVTVKSVPAIGCPL